MPSISEGWCFVASLLVATLGDERTLDDVSPEPELGVLKVRVGDSAKSDVGSRVMPSTSSGEDEGLLDGEAK